MKVRRPHLFIAAALVAFSTGVAFADDYLPTPLTAPQILAHAKSALGVSAKGTYTIVTHSHGGGMDSTTTTRTFGNDLAVTTKNGGFTTAYGTYNGTHWIQNANGFVRIATDFRSTEDPNTLALEHPDDPKYHVRVLGLTQTQPPEYAIELNPPGGSDEFLYYDAATYFLNRDITFEKDRHRHVATYTDYRSAFGRFRPYRSEYADGRPQNDTVDELVSVDRSDIPASLAVPPSRALFDLPTDVPITLPARFTSDGIIVRVNVAGQGLDFLLDSGASTLVIDPGVAHRLGLVPYGKTTDTIGGEIDDSSTHIPQMTIGKINIENAAFDISPLDQQTDDVEVVGILGCDFIANGILGVDFKKETVTLYPRATFDPLALGLQTTPVDLDDCVPRTKASFEDVVGSFLIDSGSFSTMAYQNYIDKLPKVGFQQDGSFSAVGGNVRARYMNVANFRFGGVQFDNATVLVPSESTFDLEQYDGIIGRDALKYYRIYFDYAKQAIYLKPNP